MGTSADAQAGVEEGWDLVCEAGKDARRGRGRGGVDEMMRGVAGMERRERM